MAKSRPSGSAARRAAARATSGRPSAARPSSARGASARETVPPRDAGKPEPARPVSAGRERPGREPARREPAARESVAREPARSEPAKRAAAKRTTTKRETPAGRYGFLTVGQTAKILGVSPSTLRLWESEGLVAPLRTTGRYRLYSPELLKVLKRIKYLREVQRLNMPGIRRELGTKGAGGGSVTSAASSGGAIDAEPGGAGRDGAAASGGRGGGRRSSRAAAAQAALTPPRRPERPLGPQLRRLRERKALGLVEAARRAGVSAGFLSSVEHGQANASVATLQRLAMCYGTTVMDLFQRAPHEGRLVKPGDRRVLTVDPGVRMEMLSTGAPMLQSMLFRIAPLAGSEGAYTHQGEEFIYMLSGVLEMWLDELECFVLREGDSFWFPSTQAHRWFNPGQTDAVLIWINTPPTF